MADIFISYSSKDRHRIKQISAFFESQGWTTWWDPKIPIGESFESVLMSELEKAQCVVVVWTKNSIKSAWVKREAETAINHQKLVPVMSQPVNIPPAFNHLEAAYPEGWINLPGNEEIQNLLGSVRKLVRPSNKPTATNGRAPNTWSLEHLYIILGLFAGVILYILYLFTLKGWGLAYFQVIRVMLFAGISSVLMFALYNKTILDKHIIFPQLSLLKRPVIWLIPVVILILNIGLMPVAKIFKIYGKLQSTSGAPVSGAQVSIDGTPFHTFSRTDGTFILQIENYNLGDEISIQVNHSDYEDYEKGLKLTTFVLEDSPIFLTPIDPSTSPPVIVGLYVIPGVIKSRR